ncbi:MAG TPA: ribose-5-phosphate isomerase RpiA [Planctomycetaceae bacterium]|jgi:ribose 5-phosphate isomerase A
MNNPPSTNPAGLAAIAQAAVDMIQEGFVVGLGSGRAATTFIESLGKRVSQGLHIRGVPTSQATADLATRCAIPLTTLDAVEVIDMTVDGADEVDPQLDLIKGWGGALVREKIVAAASKRLVIVVGSEKLVTNLGLRGKLPVEVIPFALGLCRRRLADLGLTCVLREAGGKTFVSDNGNFILDCQVPAISNPLELESELRSIPGLLGTGLFLGMADTILIQEGDEVQIRRRSRP